MGERRVARRTKFEGTFRDCELIYPEIRVKSQDVPAKLGA